MEGKGARCKTRHTATIGNHKIQRAHHITQVKMGEGRGEEGGGAETNIMWQEPLIYTGVIHAVNNMHVMLSCTKECV